MKNEIVVLIVEDEDIWVKALKIIVQELGMEVAGAVKTFEDALVAFNNTEFDIALLDIQIGNTEKGIELGNILSKEYKKPFIYVTAGQDFSIQKIAESSPAAFLQKPVSANALNIAVNQALEFHQEIENRNSRKSNPSVFFIKEGTRYKKLDWNDIAYITAGKNYVTVYNSIDKVEYYIRNSLQKTLQYLIPKELQDNFIQVNRSQIVQFSHIREITGNEVITDHERLAISDGFMKDMKSKMNIV
jgi:DNA-binding LytR/AlgR family response regulator